MRIETVIHLGPFEKHYFDKILNAFLASYLDFSNEEQFAFLGAKNLAELLLAGTSGTNF